ncbi:3-methyl-2-oxobutanoate hydroxymethyltransferase [Bacillus lacus]|uniref:3-methyl-2-oxobutanoate hydroxymethyltransferase n=1 Tax=Metabacillus lacus TaxID=1983721 RepID=A0A7X2LW11_9BACI|nr:3-methyl-2-oxobutanoate hydroxymethyltransferase [Metabacillus lacus]MRX70970.1 3-methyl-2-oxobutanoate hydroxymethyltransferase [Metabacillus lacus]
MKTVKDFLKMKKEKEPIAMITAYDYPSAKRAEEAEIDMILVGDSLGMVVLGYESTVKVTLSDMIHHSKAVRNGAPDTFIVTDMPFMSYHISREETLRNAAKIIQEGLADAVKLEGAGEVVEMISSLTRSGIAVVAHLGLTPQSVGVLGGYKVQGKDADSARKLIEDAKKCEEAGACALVLECVPRQIAEEISSVLSIPTIGIGAGSAADGQVLVYHDLIGYGVDRLPKFVKQYSHIDQQIHQALKSYKEEVKLRAFPELQHTFTMKEEELEALYGGKK